MAEISPANLAVLPKRNERLRQFRELSVAVLSLCGALFLLVHSPVPKLAPLADSAMILLGAGSLAMFLVFSVSFLWALSRRRYLYQRISALEWRKRHEEQEDLERELTISQAALSKISVIAAIGGTTLLFSFSIWLLANRKIYPPALSKDWGGLLLASASLALFIFSSLIAVFAIFGWRTLIEHIDSRVKKFSEAKFLALRKDTQGRFLSVMGYTMGELNLVEGSFEAKDMNRMAVAVEHCRRGYEQLKKSEPGPRSMALNNYVYYRALLNEAANAPWLLEHARELLEIAQEYRIPRLLLTYCRVVSCYAERDSAERSAAESLLASLIKGAPLEPEERKEALHCQSLFSDPQLPYKATTSSRWGQ